MGSTVIHECDKCGKQHKTDIGVAPKFHRHHFRVNDLHEPITSTKELMLCGDCMQDAMCILDKGFKELIQRILEKETANEPN